MNELTRIRMELLFYVCDSFVAQFLKCLLFAFRFVRFVNLYRLDSNSCSVYLLIGFKIII